MVIVIHAVESYGELVVTPASDFHIGSGASRPGVIDSLVVQDADGIPYIPATHLRNNLRWWLEGALEHAGSAVCLSGTNEVSCAVTNPEKPCLTCEVFGAGGAPAKVAFSDAKPHPLVAEVLREPELDALRAHLLTGRMHVSLDAVTGSQVTGRLYSNELAISGIPYVASVTRASGRTPVRDPLAVADALWFAAALVPALGKRRRRGYGEARVEFVPSPELLEIGWSEQRAAKQVRGWYS